mmetsp:Transcript_112970/g.319508  ORF Transcript_112970/g.319508 Transcript_112970/m.319508 type:complete len:250 (-) Transcript_112970:23-772(-)
MWHRVVDVHVDYEVFDCGHIFYAFDDAGSSHVATCVCLGSRARHVLERHSQKEAVVLKSNVFVIHKWQDPLLLWGLQIQLISGESGDAALATHSVCEVADRDMRDQRRAAFADHLDLTGCLRRHGSLDRKHESSATAGVLDDLVEGLVLNHAVLAHPRQVRPHEEEGMPPNAQEHAFRRLYGNTKIITLKTDLLEELEFAERLGRQHLQKFLIRRHRQSVQWRRDPPRKRKFPPSENTRPRRPSCRFGP